MSKYFLSDTDEGTWSVRYGTEDESVWVNDYRAKSRSRFEMQYLLDHVNEKLSPAALYDSAWFRLESKHRNADNKERNK